MNWIWRDPSNWLDFDVRFDYEASEPLEPGDCLSEHRLNTSVRPVFRSRNSIRKFRSLHCPPIDQYPTVDAVWRDIILSYVPEDRIQFLPIRLIARGEICDDFMWVIPLDRVKCISINQSNAEILFDKPNLTYLSGGGPFVHTAGCLGNSHLARDMQLIRQLIVSDPLKEALSMTGEDSMFRRPENTHM